MIKYERKKKKKKERKEKKNTNESKIWKFQNFLTNNIDEEEEAASTFEAIEDKNYG